uniref:Transforming acidic coiled-coil-containing protein C-terminal domain-containing protein n=1 Tax=Myotis lucifugus TaxID=59463 RepID=G1PYI1_MYOLU
KSCRAPVEILGTNTAMGHLEQSGTSSFKESALRKQLYLRFDPQLKDSSRINWFLWPLRQTAFMMPRSLPKARPVAFDFLGALDILVTDFPPCTLGLWAPLSIGPIMDVLLQVSQKNLDMMIKAMQMENLELKSKYEELHLKYLEMRKIMGGFLGTVPQETEEAQKQKEIAKGLKGKGQLITDMNSINTSFSGLFKGYEKQKEVIKGYSKNIESLNYECKWKAHTDEKFNVADEEIAQVHRKVQVILTKGQMRNHSLEIIRQKTKDYNKLIITCYDLISEVKKS